MKIILRVLTAICLGLFLFYSPVSADSNLDLWNEANQFYQEGKFAEAAKKYELLLTEDQISHLDEAYYNLGNSYFRNEQLNLAILNFERAIALNPWHQDSRYNLNVAREKLEYQVEDQRNFFIRFYSLVLQWVQTSDLFTVGFLFLALALVSGCLWAARGVQSVPFLSFPRTELFVLVIIVFILGFSKLLYHRNYQEAIVIKNEVDVRYGPSLDNQSLIKLGEGLKVFVVDEREVWSRVLLFNGETGWIKNTDIGKIKR